MMTFHSIVVPFDSSAPSKKALNKAIDFCKENPACRLYVISVVVPDTRVFPAADPIVFNAEEYQSLQRQSVEKHKEALESQVRPLVADLPNDIEIDVLSGESPAESIDLFAEGHDSDLIVMGSRGLGSIRGAFGSVSKGVLHRTAIPVLIVK